MQITKVLEGDVLPTPKTKTFTDRELQNEFYLAEKIVHTMHEKGLISAVELQKISEKNRRIFSPYLCDLYQ